MTATVTPAGMIVIETPTRVHIAGLADLVEPDHHEMAWASDHIRVRPDFGWLVGRYVEADNPNENGHIFPLEHLRANFETIVSTPLNLVHDYNHVVGAYTAARLVEPPAAQVAAALAAAGGTANRFVNPHVEAVAAVWKYAFPVHYEAIKAAHANGSCWFSMESVPKNITCPECAGADAAEMSEAWQKATFPYRGPRHESYCAHLNVPRGARRLNHPHFVGGAVILPPVRPGWKKADITELAGVIEEHLETAESVYQQVANLTPHLTPADWEAQMAQLLAGAFGPVPAVSAKQYSFPERMKMRSSGEAMPDGSFPIANVADLRNAIQAYGRAKNKPEVKKHIIKRAKALKREDLLPDEWTNPARAAAEQPAPDGVLDAYRQQLEDTSRDGEDDAPVTTVYPLAQIAGRLWQLKDGWGEWYFVEAPDGAVRWVAAKWPDAMSWNVSDEVGWTKADVRKIGMGDQEWINALVERLNEGANAATAAALETAAGPGQGVIVALVPPAAVAQALASLGTEAPEQIHVTLAFLGTPDGDGLLATGAGRSLMQHEVAAALGVFCAGARPLAAKVSGLGRFALDDGTEVTYASVDAPGLNELRARLVAAFAAVDIPVSADHGFTPHASVAYHQPGGGPTDMPDDLTWTVDHLELWWAGAHASYPLLGGMVPAGEE